MPFPEIRLSFQETDLAALSDAAKQVASLLALAKTSTGTAKQKDRGYHGTAPPSNRHVNPQTLQISSTSGKAIATSHQVHFKEPNSLSVKE